VKHLQIFLTIAAVAALQLSATAAQETPASYEGVMIAASVRIILFSDMTFATSSTQARSFGAGDDDDLAKLRTAVAQNPAAQQALADVGLTTEDVAAVVADQRGGLILYVDNI
jgi:hypothetical protein